MPEYDSDCQRPEFFSGFVSAASLVWSIFGENEYHFLTELHSEIQKAYHLKMWITDLYFTMISMSSMWTCQKRWRIWDFTLYKSQRVIFIDAGRRQRLLGQRQRTSIQSMSIHVHIVFYCPQRPQNNIGRVRQLLQWRVCASAEELSLGERFNLMGCDVLPNLSKLGSYAFCSPAASYGDIILIVSGCLQYKCLWQNDSEWKCSVNCLENEKNMGAQGELCHSRVWVWEEVGSCYLSCASGRTGQKRREGLYLFHDL